MSCFCITLLTVLFLGTQLSGAQLGPEYYHVFVPARDGYRSIRIPSVVTTRSGTVIAIAEGRAKPEDQANNDLIFKRSHDGGITWTPMQVLVSDGDNSLNNPCAVIEENTGRIYVMFQSYPAGLKERDGKIVPGLEGTAIVRNLLVWSNDDGAHWSPKLDVTRTTKNADKVTILASGPGIGIQLKKGPHKGRLIFPFNEGPFDQWNVLAVYSDDRGLTWHTGKAPPGCQIQTSSGRELSCVNEVQMAELNDGSVLLNSRKWGGKNLRKVARSQDGGLTWSAIQDDPALRDPGCMASLLRYSFAGLGRRSILLYSGPDSTERRNGTLFASYDEGRTWPVKRVLVPGSFAYSVLTRLSDGSIGCLYEADNINCIVFARIPFKWLTPKRQGAPQGNSSNQ